MSRAACVRQEKANRGRTTHHLPGSRSSHTTTSGMASMSQHSASTNGLTTSEAAQRRQGSVASGALFLHRAAGSNQRVGALAPSKPPDLPRRMRAATWLSRSRLRPCLSLRQMQVLPPARASPTDGANGDDPRGAASTEANGSSRVDHANEPPERLVAHLQPALE